MFGNILFKLDRGLVINFLEKGIHITETKFLGVTCVVRFSFSSMSSCSEYFVVGESF